METMMESIMTSNQWDKQCELHETDLMITERQLHLMETIMTQVEIKLHLIICVITGCAGDSKWGRMLQISPET